MLERGIDTVVLGCTHYPFVIPLIKRIVGPNVRVIDPAPAVARQTGRLLYHGENTQTIQHKAVATYYTTAAAEPLLLLLPKLLGESGKVCELRWQNGELRK
jgi:glutamate racemase